MLWMHLYWLSGRIPISNKIAIVASTDSDLHHWVLNRLLKRTGIDSSRFEKISLESGESYENYPGYILIGESVLNQILGEAGIDRWMNRIVSLGNIPILPLASPQKLSPFATVEDDFDEEETEKKFRSPTRYYGLINQQIHKLVSYVQTGSEDFIPVPYEKRNYSWDDLEKFEQFVADQKERKLLLACDIETAFLEYNEEDQDRVLDKDTIMRISFSNEEYQGISVPFKDDFLELGKELLLDDSFQKVWWNGPGFDIQMLEKMNGIVVAWPWCDAMDIAHVIQPDLDKGLESCSGWMLKNEAPWKHLSQLNAELYSAIDSDVTLRCWNAGVKYLQSIGLWSNFQKHFMKTRKYMHVAHRNGILIDIVEQQKLSYEYRKLSVEKTYDMQEMVPLNLQKRKLYSRQMDESMLPIDGVGVEKYCSFCGQVNVSAVHPCIKKELGEIQTREKIQTFFYKPLPARTSDYPVMKKWLENNGFNPNSAEQIKSYIRANHHPLSENWKTKSESADTKHLESLAKVYGKKHPIYEQLVDSKKLNKALTSFVDGWVADSRGKITTTLGNGTNSLRLNAKNCNIHQVSVRASNPYASNLRRLFIPPEGHSIVGIDSTAIEAVISGFYMQDPDYIQAAKDDIHSFVVSRHLGWEWKGKETAKKIKKDFNKLRDDFKVVNHALNFGASAFLVHKSKPDVFPSVAAAQKVVDSIYANLPRLKIWHDETREEALQTGKLTNCYGYTFYFNDVSTFQVDEYGRLVLDKEGKPLVKMGKDKSRILAIKPQSTAAIFMRDSIWMIGECVPEDYITPLLSIHDASYLVCPDSEVESVKELLTMIFEREVLEMDNLSIGSEVKSGKNWLELN